MDKSGSIELIAIPPNEVEEFEDGKVEVHFIPIDSTTKKVENQILDKNRQAILK